MYTKCKDSFIDSINSPLLSSHQNSTTFSNISFLLNSIPESIVIISEKGIILEINSATSRLFGWTKDEIINRKNISFLLTNRDGEKLMNIINNEEISSFIDFTYHYHGLNKNGSTFPCDISFGIFPKTYLENSSSSSSSNHILQSNNIIIVVINTNKKGNRTSDSVLLDLKSRYQNEYDEIEALGKGGFGQVYKARNRLDGQLYAIKKIKLQSKPKEFSNSFDLHAIENLKTENSNNATSTTTSNLSFLSAEDLRIVREVKTFARISNHPNIVRYHASWIEVEEKVSKKDKKKDGSYDSDSSDSSSEYDENDDEIEENSQGLKYSSEVQNNGFSYSDNNSLSNNINFNNQNNRLNSNNHLNVDNQPSNNDFIISFGDSGNTGNNNSNDFFIDMNDLDSLRSNKSDDDESTDINSSEDISFNPFSFRSGNRESIPNEQQQQQNHHDTFDKINKIKKLKKKDNGKTELDPRNTSIMKPLEKQNNLRLFLIIQMELCSGQTLETWIRERNQLTEKKEIHIDRKVIFKIFKQIVQAIAHVHWNGCIHRDVKPANVFLQDDNHILLGDFGLAKDVDFNVASPNAETVADTLPISTTLVGNESELGLESESESESEETEISKNNKYGDTDANSTHVSNVPNLTSGVGTYIYASPEQLASSQGYDNKTDIYSLGILLFELLWPFKTGMERIKTLTNIRNGKFPDNFVEKWPLELPFLKSLLNPDPALRPTAQEILDSEVLNINYITPLYNNPTNLLNALDLRVTRVTFDPNENNVMPTTRKNSKERKGHNKTLSNASKVIKNYGDCGACKQKDLAISSFRNQFLKTKVTISELEDTIAKTSKRVWVMSILTFILGCILTLGITLLIFNHSGRSYETSSIGTTGVNLKANLNNNLDLETPNYNPSAFVPEITSVPPVIEISKEEQINPRIDNTPPEIKAYTTQSQNIIENDDKSQFSKRNKQNMKNNFKREKINTRENLVFTQTLSINYFYRSRTLTVTKTKSRTIHFEAIATNTQPFDSTPTN